MLAMPGVGARPVSFLARTLPPGTLGVAMGVFRAALEVGDDVPLSSAATAGRDVGPSQVRELLRPSSARLG